MNPAHDAAHLSEVLAVCKAAPTGRTGLPLAARPPAPRGLKAGLRPRPELSSHPVESSHFPLNYLSCNQKDGRVLGCAGCSCEVFIYFSSAQEWL